MAEILTPDQQLAVDYRGGNLLVSAAAGSGKTKILIDRMLGKINDTQIAANVDDFLIITFSKAAAAELRSKISAKIGEKIAEDPANRHLQKQLRRLYLAHISTVHSFCSDILREYAYMLDIPADFRVLEEQEAEMIQHKLLEQVLDEAYDTVDANPDFCVFLDTQGFGRDDAKIPEILLQVYRNAMCHKDPEKWLDACVKAYETDADTDMSQTVWGKFLIDDLHDYLRLQTEALERCRDLALNSGNLQKTADLLDSTIAQLRHLSELESWDAIVNERSIDFGRLSRPGKDADMSAYEKIRVIREYCKKGIQKKLRVFSNLSRDNLTQLSRNRAAVRGLAALIHSFDEKYERYKRSRRMMDFNDLEHKTLALLLGKNRSGRTAIAEELGRRYLEIMVDEYQDTNEIQDAIFSALSGDHGNCFFVGDVKQSIYRFRLADPDIFLQKYNAYPSAIDPHLTEGRKVLLSSNFRSGNSVIQAVNDVFRACMSPRVGGLRYGQEEQLNEGVGHIDQPETEVELHVIDVQEDTYLEEAAFTAERIRQLLDGTHTVRDGDRLRPIMPEDIVILLRSPASVGREFQLALERAGIRCDSGSREDILRTEEIQTILAILQVISNPLQDIPLVAALTSRIFCFTADDLARLRAGHRSGCVYDALLASGDEKAKEFLRILSVLRQQARVYSLTQLLECIYTQTAIQTVFSALPDGAARAANLQTFFQYVSDFESIASRDITQLLEHLTTEDVQLKDARKTSGSVSIMSIHASKGLEFPVVFLCTLSRSFNTEDLNDPVLCHKDLGLGVSCVNEALRVRYPSTAKRAIAAKLESELLSEEMRLLYVAMTRAKDRLIMTYASRSAERELSEISCRAGLCSPELICSEADCIGTWILFAALKRTEAGELFPDGVPLENTAVSDVPWKIQRHTVRAALTSCQSSENGEKAPAIVDDMLASLGYAYPYSGAVTTPSKLTATQLKGRYKDEEAAQNAASSHGVKREFRLPDFVEKRASRTQYGTAMHTLMQYIDFSDCTEQDAIKRQIDGLVSQGILEADCAKQIDTNSVLRFFQSELGTRLTTAEKVLREYKFSLLIDADAYFPEAKGEKILLQGVADCFIMESDGITVIDFKTDHVTSETLQKTAALYTPQVMAYCRALTRIFNCPIKDCYLYFFRMDRAVKV